LLSARKVTKPRTLELSHVFNALLYVVKTGCQWRALPKDYTKWRSVHSYFQIWNTLEKGQKETTLDQVLKKLIELERIADGREPSTSMGIVDAQYTSHKAAKVLADGGYTGDPFKDGTKRLLNAEVEIAKRSDGWWSVPFLGLRSADGCGRMVRGW
jgi:transposase